MDNNAKSFLKSKLFWLGLLNIIGGIITYFSGAINNGEAITLNGILIIVLRIFTNQGIKLK